MRKKKKPPRGQLIIRLCNGRKFSAARPFRGEPRFPSLPVLRPDGGSAEGAQGAADIRRTHKQALFPFLNSLTLFRPAEPSELRAFWTPSLLNFELLNSTPRLCAAVWHLRWVCRRPCEMLRSSELHTTAAIIPPRPCAACVWHLGRAAAEKIGRRWGNYGGGVSGRFFGYLVFLLHPEVLSCWLLVFCAFDDVCA